MQTAIPGTAIPGTAAGGYGYGAGGRIAEGSYTVTVYGMIRYGARTGVNSAVDAFDRCDRGIARNMRHARPFKLKSAVFPID